MSPPAAQCVNSALPLLCVGEAALKWFPPKGGRSPGDLEPRLTSGALKATAGGFLQPSQRVICRILDCPIQTGGVLETAHYRL